MLKQIASAYFSTDRRGFRNTVPGFEEQAGWLVVETLSVWVPACG
jgi:hypothetical protein